jgi:MFS family permease
LRTLLVAVFLSSLFSPFAFYGDLPALLAGMVFWGIGYATQDTLFKAVVAGVLPEGKRNLAFGLFYSGYGAGWLIGSVATGLLYEPSRVALVAFAVLAQLISLPLFVIAKRQEHSPQ